jgi:hypothetical protein
MNDGGCYTAMQELANRNVRGFEPIYKDQYGRRAPNPTFRFATFASLLGARVCCSTSTRTQTAREVLRPR